MSFVPDGVRLCGSCGAGSLDTLGERTLVMGVLNITPDSFSGDGLLADQDLAVESGLAMLEAGAAMLDVGGESTRPGKRCEALPAEDEIGSVCCQ